MKIVSSVTFDDEYKILKTESRIMANLLKSLKMPLFLGLLRNPFVVHFNDNALEEKLLEYIKLNRNKMQYVWIDEFKKWLKELREVIDLLEWKLKMERILMKDNDKDEYLQYMELDKIKQKSKQVLDKINELIIEKEMDIIDNDQILKLKDYKRDVQEELKIVEIILRNLKMPEGRIDELKSQYLDRL